MRRAVTKWLKETLWIKQSEAEKITVNSWVGFAADEQHRANKLTNEPRWQAFTPLIELGMSRDDCVAYHKDRGLPEPIPSRCRACFSEGLRSLKWKYENDPDAWAEVVRRDEFVRHGLKKYGVREEVYVSSTGIPVTKLAEMNFELPALKETAKHECSQGVCFT